MKYIPIAPPCVKLSSVNPRTLFKYNINIYIKGYTKSLNDLILCMAIAKINCTEVEMLAPDKIIFSSFKNSTEVIVLKYKHGVFHEQPSSNY